MAGGPPAAVRLVGQFLLTGQQHPLQLDDIDGISQGRVQRKACLEFFQMKGMRAIVEYDHARAGWPALRLYTLDHGLQFI